MRTPLKKLIALLRSSGAQSIVSSGVVLLLTVLTGVLSARLLHVEDRGITAAVLAFGAMLAQALNAGPAETQLIAPRRGYPLGITVRVTWLFSLGIVMLSAVPAIAYLAAISNPRPLLVAVVATTPAVATIGLLCNYLLLGEKRYGASALLRMLPVVLQAFTLIVVWLTGTASVLSVILASWIAGLLASVIGLIFTKPWSQRGGSFKQHARAILRIIFTVGGSHTIRIIGYRIDLILLGILAGPHAAGMYSVAISLTSAGISLTANLTPLVTMRTAGADSARFTQVSSLFTAVVAIGIAILGPLVIPLVYGERYAPGWTLISTLAAAMYGSFLLDTVCRLFQRAGQERFSLRISCVVLIAQLVLISIGALTLGGVGAALGNLVAYSIGFFSLIFISEKLPGAERLLHQLSPIAGLRILIKRFI